MLTIIGTYFAVVCALFVLPYLVEDFWAKVFDGAELGEEGRKFLEWHQAEPLSGPLFALFWPHTLYRAFRMYRIRTAIKEELARLDQQESEFEGPLRWGRQHGHRCPFCDLDNRWHASLAFVQDEDEALVLDLTQDPCFTRHHYTRINDTQIYLHGKVQEDLAQQVLTLVISTRFRRTLNGEKPGQK